MDLQKSNSPLFFRIKARDPRVRVDGDVVSRGRLLVGRAESCDVIIDSDSISAIHAVIEIFQDSAKIYDMNSTNGTWVGGKKIVVADLRPGDAFALADIDLSFIAYRPEEALPPVLDALEPAAGSASVKAGLPPLPTEPASVNRSALPKAAPAIAASEMPYVVYPLAADPRADQSEYIFEDAETLYPIFRYDVGKQAVEVIILFKDRVYGVDYLPAKDGTYHLAGHRPEAQDLEFPYLGKTEKVPFVDVRGGVASVHKLTGYEVFHLSDKQAKAVNQGGAPIELGPQDLVRFTKGDIQIFVRNVEAPPKVAGAPLLRRDPVLRRYLVLFIFAVAALSGGIQLVKFEDEKKIEEEKAPERLATILYKQKLMVNTNPAVEKTEAAKPQPQKAPPKEVVKKEEPKVTQPTPKPDVQDNQKTGKPDPGKQTAPEKVVVKQGDPKLKTPEPAAAKSGAPAKTAVATQQPVKSQYEAKTNGPVDVYKSVDFSSSVNTMLAKGGSLQGVTTKAVGGSASDFGAGVSTGAGTGTELQKAAVTSGGGSLVGATTGTIGTSKGAEGLSAKRAIYTAGIPSETVVLGSMDPDVIRRILMDNLPKFRYCYQSELEKSGAELQGVIKLNFVIGASGNVSQAGVDDSSSLPAPVKRCVVDVLRGIQFPEPMGGGTVEVKQPMNFYPKRL